jgi:hypothetical protein
MASMSVPDGKPLADRLGGPSAEDGLTMAEWMAAPPAKLATLEPGPGVLTPPGPRTVQHRVDIPAEGSDR